MPRIARQTIAPGSHQLHSLSSSLRARSEPTSTVARLSPVNLAAWLGLVLCTGSGLLPWNPVHAQTTDATDQAAVHDYDIPAGPLSTSLATFASQSGLLLSFDPALTRGLNAPALSGSHTTRAGLEGLLAGSGLEAVVTPSGSYTLQRRLPPGASGEAGVTLPVVTVTGSAVRDSVTEGTGSYTTRSTSAATGLDLSLRETPQSVTVITRERMDDQALDSLGKALEQTTGIYSPPTAASVGSGNPLGYARGYRINSVQIDGVSTPTDAFSSDGWAGSTALDTAIYDSVAVVRGATGLLTGAGDPSASISLTRKRPTHEFQASVAQSLGRWGQRRTVADIGGPLNAAESLRGRLVAAYDEGGSWLDRYQGYKAVVYGVLEADLSDKTTLSLSLEHGQETTNGAAVNEAAFPIAFTDGSRTPFSRGDNRRVSSYLSPRSCG